MDLKPVVTYYGEENLCVKLSQEIERRLPKKPIDWKRTYSRALKTVCLKATFTKFNSDQLEATNDGTVSKQPFLHLYWTSCMENDEFRNGIKQKIINWQENLKSRDINDWLIIQVVTQDSQATRSRITLPRSSVFDKIKNDLCGKDIKRVAQLWQPDKEGLFTKSGESWEALLTQLRQLLLDSLSKHVTKFEEKVRHLREKYSEPSWSFIEYLKLNEELATILKSVTLHEEALVQYDELDALFSQFVVNGNIKGIPSWMEQFTKRPDSWDGVSLQKQAVKYYRDAVYEGRASLLELRNYIFIRQWQMLIKINRSWDVAHRLLEFLFTVVNEIKILLPKLSASIPACWVISSCLEYIKFVEEKEITHQTVMSHLAQIFDYAREKLLFIGKECSLLPTGQRDDAMVRKLTEGLCKSQASKEGVDFGSKSLMTSMNSQENYDKLYLRICGKTKTLYQNVRRYRFASRVGVDIANFYMMKKKYASAEKQLTVALHEYRQSKWTNLSIDVLEPLATCHINLNSFDRYLCSLASLSCACTLSVEKRLMYADMFLGSVHNEADHFHTISTDPVIGLEQVQIDLTKEIGHIGEIIRVNLTLRNNLLKEITIDDIEIRMQYTETDQVRLSEVDSGLNISEKNANEMGWSEVFDQSDEVSNPSTPKSTIFQRIKSRRHKQKEVFDNASTNDFADNVIERGAYVTPNEAEMTLNRGPLNKIFDERGSAASLGEYRPKTLAEIAKQLPRTMSLGDELSGAKSDSSAEPIAIPNGGLGCRCDSSAGSLSLVSISSDKEGSSFEGLSENSKLEESPSLFYRRKMVSFMNEKARSSSAAELAASEEDPTGLDTNDLRSTVDDTLPNGEMELETEALSEVVEPDANDETDRGKIAENDEVKSDDRNLPQADNEYEMEKKVGGMVGLDLGSVSEASDCGEDEALENGLVMKPSEKDDVFDDVMEEDIGVMSEIEEETEPAKSLRAGTTKLAVGENVVTLTAKVMHVGRYHLHTLKCKIGNVILMKLMNLPQKSRAFFVISDPPKFCWTSNHLSSCLLLGNKQRIHVTLSNGPGFIPASSVVQLSSPTGLVFSHVPPSSVLVYWPNQKDDPKEGAMQIEVESSKANEAIMYLPECGPYKMVDLYFDVTAPVENADLFGHMARHEVTLNCLWLSDLIDAKSNLESIFYEPFSFEHDAFFSTAGNFVRTVLKNVNQLQIDVIDPILECLNAESVTFSLVPCDIQMNINANEEISFIWKTDNIGNETEKPPILICRLKVNFKTEDQEDMGGFSKQFEVANTTPSFGVTTKVGADEDGFLVKGKPYPIEVTITNIGKLSRSYHNGKLFCKIVDNDQWKFNDDVECRKFELHDNDDCFCSFTTSATPYRSGQLRHPDIVLSKVLENAAAGSPDNACHVKKHRVGSSVTKDKLSSSRRTSASTADDVAHSFPSGEVLYTSCGVFVNVRCPTKQETTV
ncbi:uncharacterized protein LOC135685750 [Rhopilema esculentum]|uniref:uncharacterized protein LOC135685750 n=1 Tax=Rhopilema esculentum TaxID=499914 RepID=UPI0031D22861